MNICAKWRGMKIFLSVVMETRVLHVSPSISLLWKRNMQETFKWRLVKSWTSAFIRDAISCNCWQSDDGRSAILIALHAQVSLNILHKNPTEKNELEKCQVSKAQEFIDLLQDLYQICNREYSLHKTRIREILGKIRLSFQTHQLLWQFEGLPGLWLSRLNKPFVPKRKHKVMASFQTTIYCQS